MSITRRIYAKFQIIIVPDFSCHIIFFESDNSFLNCRSIQFINVPTRCFLNTITVEDGGGGGGGIRGEEVQDVWQVENIRKQFLNR